MTAANPSDPGWRPGRATDLRAAGQEPGTCDRCGRRDLRFLHVVEHAVEGRQEVGSECARRLCAGYAPEHEEKRLRNRWARRVRWPTRDWRRSAKGNETLRFRHQGESVRVTIFPDRFGGFGRCIAVGREPFFPPGRLATVEAAKLAAFDDLADAAGW